MLLRLRADDGAPLYEQIAAAARRALDEGELAPGERLPAARDLAQTLGVNMHTVLRGYAQLESEGLVQMRRGRGVTVLGESQGRARVQQLARELVGEAGRQGFSRDELIAIVSELR